MGLHKLVTLNVWVELVENLLSVCKTVDSDLRL